MIALLRGRVTRIDDDQVVLEAGGVGYQVYCHLRTVAGLHTAAGTNQEVTLHVHTAVSDDAIRLFGFRTVEELRLFRLLLGVERIGPKAALGILGRAELPTLVRAIRGEDAALVATVPGIGRKTAERVILELRDKLDGLALPGEVAATAPAPQGRQVADAVAAIVSLGFRETEVRGAMAAVAPELGEDADMAALVSAALRRLDSVPA